MPNCNKYSYTSNKNEISSATVENFNIEDYKKIEVVETDIETKEDKEG